MYTWFFSRPQRRRWVQTLLPKNLARILRSPLISVGALIFLYPQYASAEEKLRFSMPQHIARCLVEHHSSYMNVGYDPIVIEPAACPTIRFQDLDFSALARNSEESEEVYILYKYQFNCLISAISRFSHVVNSADAIIEVEIGENETCGE